MSQVYDLPLFGQFHLATRIRADLDGGVPTVVAEPDAEISQSYRDCARNVASQLSRRPRSLDLNLPQIQLQNL